MFLLISHFILVFLNTGTMLISEINTHKLSMEKASNSKCEDVCEGPILFIVIAVHYSKMVLYKKKKMKIFNVSLSTYTNLSYPMDG